MPHPSSLSWAACLGQLAEARLTLVAGALASHRFFACRGADACLVSRSPFQEDSHLTPKLAQLLIALRQIQAGSRPAFGFCLFGRASFRHGCIGSATASNCNQS